MLLSHVLLVLPRIPLRFVLFVVVTITVWKLASRSMVYHLISEKLLAPTMLQLREGMMKQLQHMEVIPGPTS
jgi:hypothetical protein